MLAPAAMGSVLRRTLGSCILVLFFAATAGVAVVDSLWPLPRPKLLGQELRVDERRRAEARWSDGTLMEVVADDLKMTSRVRGAVLPWFAAFLYRALRETHPDVVAGSDGWLFHRERIVVRDRDARAFQGTQAAQIAAVDRWLARRGTSLVVLPIPRKAVVYEETLPSGVDPASHYDRNFGALLAGLGVRHVDLLAAFRREKNTQLYHKTDTHWNDDGALLAAREISKLLSPDERGNDVTTLREVTEEFLKGDLLIVTGIIRPDGSNPSRTGETTRHIEVFRGQRRLSHSDAGEPGSPLALVGTSFSATAALRNKLVHVTGAAVRSKATPGFGPVEGLRRLLDESAASPRVLVWEIPAHYLVSRGTPLAELGRVFKEHAPKKLLPLEVVTSLEGSTFFWTKGTLRPGKVDVNWGAPFGSTEFGALVHPANGTVWLRARGTVTGAPVRVEVGTDLFKLGALWNPGEPEFLLPVTGAELSPIVRFSVRRAGPHCALTLDDLSLLVDLDLQHPHPLRIDPPLAGAGGWVQVLEVNTRRTLLPRSALDVTLPSSPWPAPTKVFLVCSDAAPVLLAELPKMRPNARILLDLARFAGSSPVRIELRGSGTPPPTGVAEGRILDSLGLE